MRRVTRQTIRAHLKGLVTEKQTLNATRAAHKDVPPDQKQSPEYRAWFLPVDYRRWQVRHQARHVLLAYAFLRGVPYRVLEARCRPDNKPEVQAIVRVLCAHGQGSWQARDAVQRWLDASSDSEAECRAALAAEAYPSELIA